MSELLAASAAAVRKLARFTAIYGPGRTLYKASGRLRSRAVPLPQFRRSRPDVGIIGCGQFAFATIAYFLGRSFGRRILACYDVNEHARESFGRANGVAHVCASPEELLALPEVATVYVASNHATHATYAAAALLRGASVYVEKPVAVTTEQLVSLLRAVRNSRARVYAGYNRPFSAAIRTLRQSLKVNGDEGISLQCFVSGHRIDAAHWYRAPEEGTRVCGNIGHWLDLFVHVLAWRGLPDRLEISLAWADDEERDDNVSITITTDRHDLFSVMLTSRCEPFEGVNETIDFQHAGTICKIDDFRRMTLWQGARKRVRRFWPKDVGHRLAIMQPFSGGEGRDWHEVVLSTLLMLHVADMVRAGVRASTFSLDDAWQATAAKVEAP